MRLALLVLVPLALAGCSGEADEPAPEGALDPALSSLSASGSSPSGPLVMHGNSTRSAAACIPPVGPSGCALYTATNGAFTPARPLAEAVVEATWTPSDPLMDTLRVEVWTAGESVGSAEGTAPLRIALKTLKPAEYEVKFMPTKGGVAFDQTVAWVMREGAA